MIQQRILDFITKEGLPIQNFKFEKINDNIWGEKYRILINFKENTENKNLFKSIKKLEDFSDSFQKFEQPLEWLVNKKKIVSGNSVKDRKNKE